MLYGMRYEKCEDHQLCVCIPAVSLSQRKRGTMSLWLVIHSLQCTYVGFRRAFGWNSEMQGIQMIYTIRGVAWHGLAWLRPLHILFERQFRCYIRWQFYLAIANKTAFFAFSSVLKTKINTFSLCKTQKSHVNTHNRYGPMGKCIRSYVCM